MDKLISRLIGSIIIIAIFGVLLYLFVVYVLPVIIIAALLVYVIRKLYRFLYRLRHSSDEFLKLAFMPLGYVSERSSSSSDLQFLYADKVLSQFDIPDSCYAKAREYINLGRRASSSEIREIISKYHQYWDRPSSRNRLFFAQISVLFCDQVLTRSEVNLFMELAGWYSYSREEAQAALDRILQVKHFTYDSQNDWYSPFGSYGSYGGYSSSGGGNYGGGGGQESGAGSAARELDEAYRILGIDASASDADARKAYRRLMAKYHPDKAMAQGLGEADVKRYTELSQKIGRAWDTVRKYRHFK